MRLRKSSTSHKIIVPSFVLVVLALSAFALATSPYTVYFRLNANTPFSTTTYLCSDSFCANPDLASKQTFTSAGNNLDYQISASGDTYFAEYDYASCKLPFIGRFDLK